MKSIIQANPHYCFLCGGNGHMEPLDKHHCFGASNRKWSEKYGLFVYLHHKSCHIFGENAVHVNAESNRKLQRYAQRKAMERYGWTIGQFRAVFGRNYLDKEE